MRDYQLQTPQKDHSAANRRSKSFSDHNKKPQKVSKKSLNSAFSLSEDALVFESPKDSIDSSSITENSEEHLLAESAEDFSVSPTPVPSLAMEADASSELTPLSSLITSDEFKSVAASTNQCGTAKQETVTIPTMEAEIVLKSLREAQLQVMEAKNLNLQSKRILDALVNICVDELIQLPEEKDRFKQLMLSKGYLMVLSFLLWILLVFAVFSFSSRSRISSFAAVPT